MGLGERETLSRNQDTNYEEAGEDARGRCALRRGRRRRRRAVTQTESGAHHRIASSVAGVRPPGMGSPKARKKRSKRENERF